MAGFIFDLCALCTIYRGLSTMTFVLYYLPPECIVLHVCFVLFTKVRPRGVPKIITGAVALDE